MQFPVLHSRTLLFIWFIYGCLLSKTLNLSLLHPLSLLVTISLFLCPWVYFCFINKFTCITFQIPHISDILQYLSFLFLTYFTQYDNIQVYSCYYKCHYFILFYGHVVFHSLYIHYILLAMSVYQWTFRLLPYLEYYKQCCSEHWGACIFSNYSFVQIYVKE